MGFWWKLDVFMFFFAILTSHMIHFFEMLRTKAMYLGAYLGIMYNIRMIMKLKNVICMGFG